MFLRTIDFDVIIELWEPLREFINFIFGVFATDCLTSSSLEFLLSFYKLDSLLSTMYSSSWDFETAIVS
jgi:hypothetical protein